MAISSVSRVRLLRSGRVWHPDKLKSTIMNRAATDGLDADITIDVPTPDSLTMFCIAAEKAKLMAIWIHWVLMFRINLSIAYKLW
jgi:hypothetical protein